MHWSFSDHLWGGQRWRSCEHLREALKCKGAVFTNMKGKYWHSMNLHVQTPYAHPSWIWFQVQGTSNLKVGCYSFKLLQSAGKEGAIYNATNSVFATQDQFLIIHMILLCNGSVLYPPIQEEEGIRRNIARGPKGRGQYFSVFPPPLGLGGTIRSLCITLPISRHAIKVNIALVQVWQDHAGRGVSILTMGMCPGQCGYGLPFRSQANANEKPISP